MATQSDNAARLNEEGAFFFQSGDENSAFAAFKDALGSLSNDSITRTSLSVSAMLSPPGPSADAVGSDGSTSVNGKESRSPLVPSSTRTEAPISGENEEPFLFDRCLSFDASHAADPEAAAYCSAIVIFNMALVFQKRDNDHKTLYKALFLYLVSLRHIKASGNDRFSKSDVVIAALNNQAVVFYKLKEFGKARAVLGEVWKLLRDLRARPDSFQKVDIDGIVQNILLLLHSPSLAAAA